MGFAQIIEFSTSNIDEVRALMDGWVAATEGKRSAHRSILTAAFTIGLHLPGCDVISGPTTG